MVKYMNLKYVFGVFFILLISNYSYCFEYKFCKLDDFFEQSKIYKDYEVNLAKNKIEEKENNISLLPSISISSGQNGSNNRGFNDIRKSSIGVSISQNIYSGGAYFKNKEKINIEEKMINTELISSRSRYLIDILMYISNYNYLLDQVSIYDNKLESQKKLMLKHEDMFKYGRISYFDLSVNNLKIKELEMIINNLKNEIDLNKKIFYYRYNIPDVLIDKIKLIDVLSCKTYSGYESLKEKYNYKKNIAYLNYEITKSSLNPSVSLSLAMSPPEDGSIENIRFSKANYNVSVNVSASLSDIFLKKTNLDKNLLDMQRINIERDNSISFYEQEVMQVKNKINNLENEISYLEDDVKLKKDKLDYIYGRYLSNKDTILSYYEQFEIYNLSELSLKKKERDVEYYKAYLHFIN